MITLADIQSGQSRKKLAAEKAVKEMIKNIAVKLAHPKAQVGTDLQTGGGKVWVRVRIKLNASHALFIDASEYDLRNPRVLLPRLFYLHQPLWHVDWDPAVPHDTKCHETEAAIVELCMAEPDIRKDLEALAARVGKLLDQRDKVLPERSKRARDAWVQNVMRDIGEKLMLVRDSIDEQDVLDLWREVIVREVSES